MVSKKEEGLAYFANTLRTHSIEMTTRAQSGHPTSCLSCAEIMSVLFFDILRFDPSTPTAEDVDEFILSKGHCAPIWYAALAEAGAFDPQKLLTLRKFESKLEGHPMPRFEWTKAATGSLGQGLGVGVGIALAQKLRKSKRITYVLLGDGEMAEGSVWEAMNSAALLSLNNLVAIIDMNRLGESGPTMHEWDSKTYKRKVEAFGWEGIIVDGHNISSLLKVFSDAKKSKKPCCIIAKTKKGKGVSFLENKLGKHGKALTPHEKELAREELVWTGKTDWKPKNSIQATSPPKTKFFTSVSHPVFHIGEEIATRDAFGDVIRAIAVLNKNVIVLDGDLKDSVRTEKFFEEFPQRSVECFIAEQNMVSIALGLATKGFFPYAVTFATFFTRAYDQLRMANYSQQPLTIVGTHSGVSIGKDGPSQMGLEDIAMMRALINSVVLVPSDAVSAHVLTIVAHEYESLSYLRLMRQKTPVIYDNKEIFTIGGSHVVSGAHDATIAILACGIGVHEGLKAQKRLDDEGIPVMVVDMYSIKPIDEKRLHNLMEKVNHIITVEDHSIDGGLGDAVASIVSGKVTVHKLGIKHIPRSGPPEELRDFFGISSKAIIELVEKLNE